jgi:hypothetical protein
MSLTFCAIGSRLIGSRYAGVTRMASRVIRPRPEEQNGYLVGQVKTAPCVSMCPCKDRPNGSMILRRFKLSTFAM